LTGTVGKLDLRGRIPELDGIRGIAIGMVLIYHYFLRLPMRPGSIAAYLFETGHLTWSGVDLFFVLSGFLIGGILLDARDSSNYFRVFYTRRFLRIIPIYVAVLGLTFALSCLVRWGVAEKLAFLRDQQLPWIAYLLFVQNFWMSVTNTFGGWGLGQTWSLAVEEQFYLTLPAVIRFARSRTLVALLAAGVVAAPVLRILAYVMWPSHVHTWVVMMPCRADALLLGVLGAMALRDPRWRAALERDRRVLVGILGVLAIGCAVLSVRYPLTENPVMLSVGFTWLAVFYLCILLYALLNRGSWMSWVLRWRWLGWLGTIAYGVYLLHEPIRYVLFGLISSGPHPGASVWRQFLVTVLALVITLVVCRASWEFFEKPLVQLGHRVRYEEEKEPRAKSLVGAAPEGQKV
jgi:peptidoglycan/LPS O-acetylase OafA/YrhL